jgi:hypothetical protein
MRRFASMRIPDCLVLVAVGWWYGSNPAAGRLPFTEDFIDHVQLIQYVRFIDL